MEHSHCFSILAVDDDRTTRDMLYSLLSQAGYAVLCADSAESALEYISNYYFDMVIIDRVLPGMDGLSLCRKLRESDRVLPFYILICTVLGEHSDILSGFDSGADDYVTKPFIPEELLARVLSSSKIISLQNHLAQKIEELQKALEKVKKLEGIIPICSWCKKVRDDQNYWDSVEEYLTSHSSAVITHGICPECMKKQFAEFI